MGRYLGGLAVAFAIVVITFVLVVTAASWRRFDAHQFTNIVGVASLFGLFSVAVLGLAIGPIVLLARRVSRARIRPAAAAAVGACLSPLCLLTIWLMFREHNETFSGLLRYWMRLPTEFVVGIVPHALGCALFAAWVVRQRPASRRAA